MTVGAIVSTAFFPAGGGALGENYLFAESSTVEEYVRDYFEETPILTRVAWCESRYRQFTKNGDILRGEVNNKDVGVMQVNEYFHLETAEKLGYNLYSLEGNLSYAQYLYEKEGTVPWESSSKCWRGGEHLAYK